MNVYSTSTHMGLPIFYTYHNPVISATTTHINPAVSGPDIHIAHAVPFPSIFEFSRPKKVRKIPALTKAYSLDTLPGSSRAKNVQHHVCGPGEPHFGSFLGEESESALSSGLICIKKRRLSSFRVEFLCLMNK